MRQAMAMLKEMPVMVAKRLCRLASRAEKGMAGSMGAAEYIPVNKMESPYRKMKTSPTLIADFSFQDKTILSVSRMPKPMNPLRMIHAYS